MEDLVLSGAWAQNVQDYALLIKIYAFRHILKNLKKMSFLIQNVHPAPHKPEV